MRSFTNFKNGTSIIQVSRPPVEASAAPLLVVVTPLTPHPPADFLLQGALTQLIQYYHSFHKVLNQPTFRSLAVRSELINLHHLMVEVKKHKPNF